MNMCIILRMLKPRARYSAIKTYTKRRLDEIFNNATDFVAKIGFILQKKE